MELDLATMHFGHHQPPPPDRGLSDALQQYGVLRSHSITQDARIRMEQRKLQHIEKRLEEEKQKRRLIDDRLRSLKSMLEDKASTAMQLERDIAYGSHLAQCLELRSMSSDFPEELSPYEDAGERENLALRQVDKASGAAEKMRNAMESESRPALEQLLKRDGTKLKAYIDAAGSLARMISQLQGSTATMSESNLSITHMLHDALAAHVEEEPTLAQQADEELARLVPTTADGCDAETSVSPDEATSIFPIEGTGEAGQTDVMALD